MFKDDPPPIFKWIQLGVETTGLTITAIIDHFFITRSLTWIIGSIITILLTGLVSICLAKKYRSQLEKKDEEIARKDTELAYKEEKIKELQEKVEVWKKVLISETPAQAGYYIANKEVYDSFKTELVISNCQLDVRLVKDSTDKEIHHLQFTWALTVLNPAHTSVGIAKFIYSGDKDDKSYPKVTINGEEMGVTMNLKEEVTGDDRFIEIRILDNLAHNDIKTICIEYTLSQYKFNKKFDLIWLVPNALGFNDMSKFQIRFFSDGEVIKDTTTCLLKSYRLSGTYPPDKVEKIDFKQLDGIGEGFKCVRQKEEEIELMERGYLLVLINDWSDLPLYLRV